MLFDVLSNFPLAEKNVLSILTGLHNETYKLLSANKNMGKSNVVRAYVEDPLFAHMEVKMEKSSSRLDKLLVLLGFYLQSCRWMPE